MWKIYMQSRALFHRLRADRGGVVSFEYVVVVGAVITCVFLAFGTYGGSSGTLLTTLTNQLDALFSYLP